MSTPGLEEFKAAVRSFLAAHAQERVAESSEWGVGSDDMAVIEERGTPEEELAEVEAAKAWRRTLLDAGFPPDQVGTFTPYDKVGCKNCNDRGFKGRVAVYEVMPMWDGLKELVINGASTAELKQEAIRLGFRTLRMSALNKVKEGVTTLAEAVGNTAPDRF